MTNTARVQRCIDYHLERAEDLERHANRWWRVSKYAWLHAANIHRMAAQELRSVLTEAQPCRDLGGILGSPPFECELPAGHTGVHKGGPISWDRT